MTIIHETEHPDGHPILNVLWPTDRDVYHVFGRTGRTVDDSDDDGSDDDDRRDKGIPVDVYVLADCLGDAVQTAAEWAGDEGGDDGLQGRELIGEERASVIAVVDAYIAAL